jgi:hypothetical protein
MHRYLGNEFEASSPEVLDEIAKHFRGHQLAQRANDTQPPMTVVCRILDTGLLFGMFRVILWLKNRLVHSLSRVLLLLCVGKAVNIVKYSDHTHWITAPSRIIESFPVKIRFARSRSAGRPGKVHIDALPMVTVRYNIRGGGAGGSDEAKLADCPV